jgi:alcohol dehydrogenase class IV
MAHNRRAIEQKCATIARVLDLPDPSYETLFAWVLELRSSLGIPHTLAEIGVGIDQAHVIGAEAEKDPSAGGNPIPVDAADLERVFRGAVLGHYPPAA